MHSSKDCKIFSCASFLSSQLIYIFVHEWISHTSQIKNVVKMYITVKTLNIRCSWHTSKIYWSRQFIHVTKIRIFKNLNLRKKAYRNFRRTFLKNRFRHLKLYSNPPCWLARGCCHMVTFWKTKDWSSHFWEGQPFRFWFMECHRQRRLKSTKSGISS